VLLEDAAAGLGNGDTGKGSGIGRSHHQRDRCVEDGCRWNVPRQLLLEQMEGVRCCADGVG
jgi:hypothetical protein